MDLDCCTENWDSDESWDSDEGWNIRDSAVVGIDVMVPKRMMNNGDTWTLTIFCCCLDDDDVLY